MRAKRGMMLIEVMAAVAILGVVGVAYLGLTSTTLARVHTAGVRESGFTAADRLLSAASLWTREDLDRRLGERQQGPFLLEVRRDSPVVYGLVVRDSSTHVVVLQTAVYRGAP